MEKEKLSNLTQKDAIVLMYRVGKAERIYHGMKEVMHRVDAKLREVSINLDGIWFHHLDGSDLTVNKTQLWETYQGAVRDIDILRKEIEREKKRVSVYIDRNGDIPR